MVYTLEEIKEKVYPIAEKYALKSVYLFGSYARGEADEASDVDLVVEFLSPDWTAKTWFRLEEDLETSFIEGVDVLEISDMMTERSFVSKLVNENFQRDKRVIYEARTA